MNTASAPVTAAQKLSQHGGVWVGLDERLFKKRIERMADLIGHIDFTKHAIPDQAQREKIAEAVRLVHTVAMHYDEKHSMGIYAKDDIDCQEVKL
jgi:hypothetical protein